MQKQTVPEGVAPTMKGAAERQAWADAAKGAAVLGVVFAHVVGKHMLALDWGMDPVVLDAARAAVRWASPIRMPLFFLISGFFAVRSLHLSWRELLSRKTLFFYTIYLLWLLVQTALFWGQGDIRTAAAHSGLELLAQATVAPTNLWFLYALALFFPLSKWAMRKPWLFLSAGVLLAVSPWAGISTWGNLGQLPLYWVWFLAGCIGRPVVDWWAGRVRFPLLLLSLALFVAAVLLLPAWKTWRPLGNLLACGLGTALGVALSVWGAHAFPGMVRFLACQVGRHTLPVYVLQMPLIVLWHQQTLSWNQGKVLLGDHSWLAALYPLVMTVAITACARLIHYGMMPVLPFFFVKPKALVLPDLGRVYGLVTRKGAGKKGRA